jgi:KTSC domain
VDPFERDAGQPDPPYRIPLEPIQSPVLSAIGFDADKQILAVQFKRNGMILHYAGVTLETALAFYTAGSKGAYYSQHIRSQYQGQRMTGPCASCGSEGFIGERCGDCGTAMHAEATSSHD